MTTTEDAYQWHGRDLVGPDGKKIGSIKDVYLDDRSGRPEWATVSTGLFGTRSSFIPLREARSEGGNVMVQFDKDKVKDAPNVDADEHLDPEEERELYRYYGIDFDTTPDTSGDDAAAPTDADADAGTRRGVDVDVDRSRDADVDRDRGVDVGGPAQPTVAEDTSGPETDSAMTRSEEEVAIGKHTQEAGRARLRKHVVTEEVTKTVPVRREEVRVEREPITDANAGAALSGKDLSEEEAEVTLHEEVVDVDKKVVPKERVRLETDTVEAEETVTEEVRKERIETDDATTRTGTATDDATRRGA